MPRKTSVSLSDEDDAALQAELARGGSLRDVIRRGLGTERVDVALAREIAAVFYDSVAADLQERIDSAVERALRKIQGGSL